jgi:hypothetical protein
MIDSKLAGDAALSGIKAKQAKFLTPLVLLVRVTGVEPAHLMIQDPKSCASANSAIPAYLWLMKQR